VPGYIAAQREVLASFATADQFATADRFTTGDGASK